MERSSNTSAAPGRSSTSTTNASRQGVNARWKNVIAASRGAQRHEAPPPPHEADSALQRSDPFVRNRFEEPSKPKTLTRYERRGPWGQPRDKRTGRSHETAYEYDRRMRLGLKPNGPKLPPHLMRTPPLSLRPLIEDKGNLQKIVRDASVFAQGIELLDSDPAAFRLPFAIRERNTLGPCMQKMFAYEEKLMRDRFALEKQLKQEVLLEIAKKVEEYKQISEKDYRADDGKAPAPSAKPKTSLSDLLRTSTPPAQAASSGSGVGKSNPESLESSRDASTKASPSSEPSESTPDAPKEKPNFEFLKQATQALAKIPSRGLAKRPDAKPEVPIIHPFVIAHTQELEGRLTSTQISILVMAALYDKQDRTAALKLWRNLSTYRSMLEESPMDAMGYRLGLQAAARAKSSTEATVIFELAQSRLTPREMPALYLPAMAAWGGDPGTARRAIAAFDKLINADFLAPDVRVVSLCLRACATVSDVRKAEQVWTTFVESGAVEPDAMLVQHMLLCFANLNANARRRRGLKVKFEPVPFNPRHMPRDEIASLKDELREIRVGAYSDEEGRGSRRDEEEDWDINESEELAPSEGGRNPAVVYRDEVWDGIPRDKLVTHFKNSNFRPATLETVVPLERSPKPMSTAEIGAIQNRSIERAQELFIQAVSKYKVAPNVHMLNAILEVSCEALRLGRARMIFNELFTEYKIQRSPKTYLIMITAFGRALRVKEVREYLERAEREGVALDKRSYGALVDALARTGDLDGAVSAYKTYAPRILASAPKSATRTSAVEALNELDVDEVIEDDEIIEDDFEDVEVEDEEELEEFREASRAIKERATAMAHAPVEKGPFMERHLRYLRIMLQKANHPELSVIPPDPNHYRSHAVVSKVLRNLGHEHKTLHKLNKLKNKMIVVGGR